MEDSQLPPQEHGEKKHSVQDEVKSPASQEINMSNMQRHPHANSRTPEPQIDRQASNSDSPDTPGVLDSFDWDEFEARYEAALRDADEQEREILKEADVLSKVIYRMAVKHAMGLKLMHRKYFKVWASAASAHDDERAAKRLQTRRRFVNLSEERMERKQEHYDQVVKAFENALALLRSQQLHTQPQNPDLLQTLFSVKLSLNIISLFILHELAQGVPARDDDLIAFHEAHFSTAALASFVSDFTNSPSEDHTHHGAANDKWEEEDGLGYYSDGVKRTLTDEQIEIFRHSELEALRKQQEKEKQLSAKTTATSGQAVDLSDDSHAIAQTENVSAALPTSFQSNKKRKKKGPKRGRPEPKPDLRKRTWDVVDKGLDSLEYD
ncbi:hypothetical protein FHETE_9969 [Fusarium heterosporum]|uniref:Uncharacterized protein n=1 Tax=Fusarium heterosporum TaxID=42747 RepID=A0A8H5SR47_FUSHE|nr:hypothetical protein FHETE_9969 [Fusarium heterosporum]